MSKHAIGFIVLASALSGVIPASAQSYLIGTKSHSQHFQSQRDPNSGYCLDGTHVHNMGLCGKAKAAVLSRTTRPNGNTAD